MNDKKALIRYTLLRYWFFFIFLLLGFFFTLASIKRWVSDDTFDSGNVAAFIMSALCFIFFFWAAYKSKLVTQKLFLDRTEINYYFPLWPRRKIIPNKEYQNILLCKIKKGLENESPPLSPGMYFSVQLNHPENKYNFILCNTTKYEKALSCAQKYAALFNLKIDDESKLNYYR